MKSRKHTLLILLASIALVGSTVLQVVWVFRGYQQAEQRIEASLKQALAGTISDLQTAEQIAFIATVDAQGDSLETHEYRYVQSYKVDSIEGVEAQYERDFVDSIQALAQQQVSVISSTDGAKMTRVEVRVEGGSENRNTTVIAGGDHQDENHFEWMEDSLLEQVLVMERSGRLQEVVERIERENIIGTKDWKNRIDSASFHQKLQERLQEAALPSAVDFAILDSRKQPFDGYVSKGYDTLQSQMNARLPLFPADLRAKNIFVDVLLPQASISVWKEIWPMTSLAFLFTLLMIGIFIVTLRRLLSQSRLSRLKTDFINNMSHELKTPLATISLATDALTLPESLSNPEIIKGFARTIHSEQQRMNEHIERVLQMAQAERGEFKLDRTSVNLSELLRDAIDASSLMVKQSGGRVELNLPENPVKASVDPVHLQAAISNLIDNALKYNSGEPVVKVSLVDSKSHASLSIQDNGIGIEPEHHAMIFSRFYRVQGGNVHTVKGFGLGLSYVSNVAKAHRGSISVESAPGQGACFTLKIPHK